MLFRYNEIRVFQVLTRACLLPKWRSARFFFSLDTATHENPRSLRRSANTVRKLLSDISKFLGADDYISRGTRSSFSDLFSSKMKEGLRWSVAGVLLSVSLRDDRSPAVFRPLTRKSISTASRINLASHLKRPITSARCPPPFIHLGGSSSENPRETRENSGRQGDKRDGVFASGPLVRMSGGYIDSCRTQTGHRRNFPPWKNRREWWFKNLPFRKMLRFYRLLHSERRGEKFMNVKYKNPPAGD